LAECPICSPEVSKNCSGARLDIRRGAARVSAAPERPQSGCKVGNMRAIAISGTEGYAHLVEQYESLAFADVHQQVLSLIS
jgi:hypothetical protein